MTMVISVYSPNIWQKRYNKCFLWGSFWLFIIISFYFLKNDLEPIFCVMRNAPFFAHFKLPMQCLCFPHEIISILSTLSYLHDTSFMLAYRDNVPSLALFFCTSAVLYFSTSGKWINQEIWEANVCKSWDQVKWWIQRRCSRNTVLLWLMSLHDVKAVQLHSTLALTSWTFSPEQYGGVLFHLINV